MYKLNLKVESGMHPEKIVDFTKKVLLKIPYKALSKLSSKSISYLSKASASPKSIDLRKKIGVMYDQGQLGSCTANSLCSSFILNDPTYNPSRLFLYYNTRMLDNNIPNDDGSTLTQGINALIRYGVCSESNCPYIISKFAIKPLTVAYTEGLKHQVISASRVLQTLDSLKGCLISGKPFVVGIHVYNSFMSNTVARTGNVPIPNINTEELLGGHAIICIGYNDTKKVWIMKNSWGPNWGDKGYFYLPYSYLTNTSLSGDVWKINQVEVLPKNIKIKVSKILESSKHLKKY